MPSANYISMTGHLTRALDVRELPSGAKVVNFGLASSHKFKKGEDWVEETTFVDVAVFGKPAEWLVSNGQLWKGCAVQVDGRLKFESWEKEGQRRSKHSIAAWNVNPIKARGEGTRNGSAPEPVAARKITPSVDDDIPF